jgi:glycosyltransferase involved in cell wall biosynthesis
MSEGDINRDASKPLVSMLLCTYQQETVVQQAIDSAFAQTYSPLEIILSDDASSDSTYSIIEGAAKNYKGPHRVIFRRNSENIGISAHFSNVAKLSSGELLFVCAGDDISHPSRCERVVQHWLNNSRRHDLIATDLLDIDEDGSQLGVLKHTPLDDIDLSAWLQKQPWLVGASHTWARRLFDRFGPLEQGSNSEDQIMLLRALLLGGATTLNEPLVSWRRGGLSRKRRHPTLKAMLEHLRKGNASTRSELKQILADAQLCGQFERVYSALQKRISREQFLMRMLDSTSIRERLTITLSSKAVHPTYRIRIFGYTTLTWIYRPIIKLKYITKFSTKKDAAGRVAEK